MTAPWPSQADVLRYASPYGDPRGRTVGVGSAAWESANLVYVKAPFKMTYAGQAVTKGMRVHRYCAASLGRVMANLLDAARGDQATLDLWGVSIYSGAHNFRLMRGLNSLSMHSFGCAIDFDQSRNSLGDATPRFAQFPAVLAAFADEKWRWGGDWNGNGLTTDERRPDGMHWQATA